MGMLIYKFSKDENYLNPENLFLISLIAIGVGLSFMENPEHRLVQRGVPAMLLVFVGLTFCTRIPINKYLVRFGDSSYSLYLLHMFVIKIADKKLKLFDGDNVFLLILFSVATVIVCLIASEISYKLVEVSSARYLKRKFRI